MDRLLAITLAGACSFACGGAGAPGDNPLPGGNLTFVDATTGRLVLEQVNGENLQYLTPANVTVSSPAITRDGKSIAFSYDPTQTGSVHLGIYSISTEAGSAPVLLAAANPSNTFLSPTWDREAQKVYFISNAGGTSSIMWVTAAGGTPTSFNTDIGSAALIKSLAIIDDNTLLVSTGTGGQLSTLDITSGMSTVVSNVTASKGAGVSHDGLRIAYVTSSGVVIQTLLDSLTSTLDPANATTDRSPRFSPDDSYVVFDDGTDLYIADGVTGATRQQLFAGTRADWGS